MSADLMEMDTLPFLQERQSFLLSVYFLIHETPLKIRFPLKENNLLPSFYSRPLLKREARKFLE